MKYGLKRGVFYFVRGYITHANLNTDILFMENYMIFDINGKRTINKKFLDCFVLIFFYLKLEKVHIITSVLSLTPVNKSADLEHMRASFPVG